MTTLYTIGYEDAELDAFNDVLPDRVKAAVRALAETAPELAASR